MASSAAHPAFPSRSNAFGKLPERPMTTFGTSTNQQRGDFQRAERERERIERESREREEQNQLSEEQKEEIKEAVRSKPPIVILRTLICSSVPPFRPG